jgi:polysaccharide pyruvyl transferase WcaK-like protein
MKVRVLGYYGHHNLGDEQYKLSINQALTFFDYHPESVEFIDCDTIDDIPFDESDFIVLGGGDILNNYFLDRVKAKFANKRNKIIAISVGIPYRSLFQTPEKFLFIDHIFLRSKQDIEELSMHMHPDRVHYLPDVSYFLEPSKELMERRTSNKKVVGISLSRHFYHPHHHDYYQRIVKNLSAFVDYLTQNNFHVMLVNLNDSPTNPMENDLLMTYDVVNGCKSQTDVSVLKNATLDQTLAAFSKMDICVPMRFHACLFSLLTKVPFIPVFSTRKIQNLLMDIDWHYGYRLPTNEEDVPTDLDLNILLRRFSVLWNSITTRSDIEHKLNSLEQSTYQSFVKNFKVVVGMLNNGYDKAAVQQLVSPLQEKLMSRVSAAYNAASKYSEKMIGVSDFRKVKDSEVQSTIVSLVCFHLTEVNPHPPYWWGMYEKMFKTSFDYKSEWEWVVRDFAETGGKFKLVDNPNGLFDLGFIDQFDYSGNHRSGWQYVFQNIQNLHNSNSELILDMYVDRTFHWLKLVSEELEIIPYKKPWIGFVHHTFDTSFSDYNCTKLLEQDIFKRSLKNCKGLCVLSRYLQNQMRNALDKEGFTQVPVIYMPHPTQTQVEKFSWKSFMENPHKKVLQVGGWLRNIYTFYNINVPKGIKYRSTIFPFATSSNIDYNKVALKGRSMQNYYPEDQFIDNLEDILRYGSREQEEDGVLPNASFNARSVQIPNISTNLNMNISMNISTNVSAGGQVMNNWYKFFLEDVKSKCESVEFIQHLQNNDYDKLLSENIIFLNLVDASAVNTVIECAVRNTPLIVNKHPAVVEILGDKYPLYYTSTDYHNIVNEVSSLLSKPALIEKASAYMSRLDLSTLQIDYFVKRLEMYVKEILPTLKK